MYYYAGKKQFHITIYKLRRGLPFIHMQQQRDDNLLAISIS